MVNSVGSAGLNNYTSVRNSNEKVKLSDDLLDYLDNSGEEGKKLAKTIKKLIADSKGDLKDSNNLAEINKYGKNFMKSYNKIIDYCRKNEDDDGLKDLTKKLRNLTTQNKDKFSALGISVLAYGKMKITDSILYANSVGNGKFSDFVTGNSGSFTKMFDKINKIARCLEKDNTTFLTSDTLTKMNDYFWKNNSQNNRSAVPQSLSVNNTRDNSYNIPGSTFSGRA